MSKEPIIITTRRYRCETCGSQSDRVYLATISGEPQWECEPCLRESVADSAKIIARKARDDTGDEVSFDIYCIAAPLLDGADGPDP